MRWLDEAALATCLRALNAMDLPNGPEVEWAPQPQGSQQTEEMLLLHEILVSYPHNSEVSFREDDECRIQLFDSMDDNAVQTHEIMVRLVNNTTVNVFQATFHPRPRERLNKEMRMDDFLFYVRWFWPIDDNGDILRNDEYARLKWVRDWCADDGRLVFYTSVNRRQTLPASTVHFCIRSKCNGWVDHFWMMLPTAIDDMRILQVDRGNDNAFVRAIATRSDMLDCLLKAANYSCSPQPRGAGFAEEERKNLPARGAVVP